MIVYWAMFMLPAITALTANSRDYREKPRFQLWLLLLLAGFTILIGFRWEVGGDWFTYEEIVYGIEAEKLDYALRYFDPGFGLITYISTRIGMGSLGPMLVCGAALTYGIWRFAQRQADPWLAITAAVPYLMIVVGMGYVRQAAAIGFLLVALIRFEEGSMRDFFKWLALGATLHASSLVILPVIGLVWARQRGAAVLIPIAMASVALFGFFLRERVDKFVSNYVEAEMDSSGALVRLAMNAVPALIFLLFRKRFPISEDYRWLWTLFASVALGLVVLVYFSPATTALDRVGLYFIPIQLFVFGNIARLVARDTTTHASVTVLVVTYYGTVLYTWLQYATHAEFWLPYQFRPFD